MKQDKLIVIRVTEEFKERLKKAASKKQLSLSSYIKTYLNEKMH